MKFEGGYRYPTGLICIVLSLFCGVLTGLAWHYKTLALSQVLALFLGLEGIVLLASSLSPIRPTPPQKGLLNKLRWFFGQLNGTPISYSRLMFYGGLLCLFVAVAVTAIYSQGTVPSTPSKISPTAPSEGSDKFFESIRFWTLIFTGLAAAAAIVYAYLAYRLLRMTERTTRSSMIAQIIANNRYFVEYAWQDNELMNVVKGEIKENEELSSKQVSYIGLLTGQILIGYECNNLGTLSDHLFEAIKNSFMPILRSPPVGKAVLGICKDHPEVRNMIKGWINDLTSNNSGRIKR